MDFLFSALAVLFVALLVAAAVTFGFVLLVWFVALAVLIGASVFLREWWRRWYFLRHAAPREESSQVIEAEYKDITDRRDI
jgi:hypothetical protein